MGLGHDGVKAGRGVFVLLPDLCRVGEHSLIERGLHMLAAAVPLASDQRRQHARRQEEARGHARCGEVQVDGPGPPAWLLPLHARASLHRGVPAGSVGKAVPGRIGRNRAEHQAGKSLGERLIREPQAIHRARAEGLHQHISGLAEPKERFAAVRRLEIEHDRSPAAVPHVIARLTAKGIASRRLDLDDVSTELGQEQDADRTGDAPTQVEHPHAAQRSCRLGCIRVHALVTRRSRSTTSVGGPASVRCAVRLAWPCVRHGGAPLPCRL